MYTHIIDEDAHNRLTRAHRATATLSVLFASYGECQDGMVQGEDIACLLEYIWEDMNAGLDGCETLPSAASIEPLRAI